MNCRIFFLLFLLFFVVHQFCYSQTVKVTGQLLARDGEPMPGVVITIKGTTTGVVTDVDGNYSIQAPENAILVFSYIGFTTREVPVSSLVNTASGKEKKQQKNSAWSYALKNGSRLEDSLKNAAPFHFFTDINRSQLRLVRKYDPNAYSQISGKEANKWPSHFNLSFISSFSADIISKLPELQHEYSQGRNESGTPVWKGPEDNEIFSWGPSLGSLEYDGIPYEYDINGRIVKKGFGNGIPVNAYEPYRFFRKGLSNRQSLELNLLNSKTSLRLAYNYSDENGVIPHSGITKNNMILRFKTSVKRKLDIDLGVKATLADIDFISGFSQSNFMQSVLKTPVTFNNATGLNSSASLSNPNWLKNNMIDHEKDQWIEGHFDVRYRFIEQVSFRITGSIESQNSIDDFGFSDGKYGFSGSVLTNRENNMLSSFLKTGFHTVNYLGNVNLSGGLYYELSNIDRSLNRTDMAVSETKYNTDQSRMVHSIIPDLNLSVSDVLILDLSARTITSTSFPKTYIKPKFSMAFIPTNFDIYYSDWFEYLKFFGSYTEGINAAPLGYKRGMFNATLYNTEEMFSYYETAEFPPTGAVSPELNNRWEYGINLKLFNGSLTSEISFYTGNTKYMLVPQYNDGYFNVINGCDIRSAGFDFDLNYYHGFYYGFSLSSTLTFTKNKTTVSRVNSPYGMIVIGGLSNVPIVLLEDQPYGVMMGNSYLHNEQGQLIVGNDGYPLVDNDMKIIGDPNPLWTMGWNNDLSYRNFGLSFTFDIRKGGDIWNGTKSALSYLGLSKESGDSRSVSSYLFDGVYSDGTINNTPVAFYDPSLPLEENRWVRYGTSGVASEAVEDGSWIRLSELSLSYELPKNIVRSWNLEVVKIKIFAGNLFVITKYSGVDPQSRFLGFENNNGIDYFNTPGVRTYGASIEIGL